MTLKSDLNDWATRNPGPRGDLAKQIAQNIDNALEKTRWSLVDIRREFEARSDGAQSRWLPNRSAIDATLKWVKPVLVAGYLVPVFLAWWHLGSAFRKFRELTSSLPEELSVDFLTYWNQGYADNLREFNGTSLSATALHIVIAVGAIMLVSSGVEWVEVQQEAKARVIDDELNDLILRVSLELGSHRAVRPEEIAEVLKTSGRSLNTGINNLKSALDGTQLIVTQVSEVSASLVASGELIAAASRGLKDSLDPLVGFANVVGNAQYGFQSAGDQITTAANSLSAGMAETLRGFATIVGQAQAMTELLDASRGGLVSVVDSTADVVSRTNDLGVRLSEMVRKMSLGLEDVHQKSIELTGKLEQVAETVSLHTAAMDDPRVQPYLKIMNDATVQMSQAVESLKKMLEHVSTQLSQLKG